MITHCIKYIQHLFVLPILGCITCRTLITAHCCQVQVSRLYRQDPTILRACSWQSALGSNKLGKLFWSVQQAHHPPFHFLLLQSEPAKVRPLRKKCKDSVQNGLGFLSASNVTLFLHAFHSYSSTMPCHTFYTCPTH